MFFRKLVNFLFLSYPAINYIIVDHLFSYVVLNTEKRRSLSSLSPNLVSGDAHSHLTPVRKRDILRTFYRTVVGSLIDLPGGT